MNSSISSSERYPLSGTARIVIGALLLLGAYWVLLQILDTKVTFAENNVNAGLLRLQNLAAVEGTAAFTVGTSITAKLHEKLVFKNFIGSTVNMGLDGGSAIFAAQKILESGSQPRIVILEANLLLKPPNQNTDTLDEVAESFGFKLAEYVPLLRREYRPVTQVYNRLKLLKDRNSMKKKGGKALGVDASQIVIDYPSVPSNYDETESAMGAMWDKTVSSLQKNGATVVLLMVPDSNNNRDREYGFGRKLAAKHRLPFVDLKGQIANENLVYSDQTHLAYKSAEQVSRLLNSILLEKNLLKICQFGSTACLSQATGLGKSTGASI